MVSVEEIKKGYSDVFSKEVGSFPGEVKLEIDTDVTPIVTPTRRIPTALKDDYKQELDRLTSLGVIAPISKPTSWVSSVVVATKKNGKHE